MPQAAETLTTPTRRTAITAAMAFMSATPSVASRAHPDADLLAARRDHAEIVAAIRRLETVRKDRDDDLDALDWRRYDALDKAIDTPAATLAGLRAKAAIVICEMGLLGIDELNQGAVADLSLSVVRDVHALAGRA